MKRPLRRFAPLVGVLALCSGNANAVEVLGPTTQVDVNTCIGTCTLWPLFPAGSFDLTDIGGISMGVGGNTAMASRTDDNGAGNDSADGQGDSTYGGALRTFARSESAVPLTGGAEIAGTSSLSLWIGEFEVAGVGMVLLDMEISASADMFIGAGSSGRAEVGVQMGAITVAEFMALDPLDLLDQLTLLDFLSGNVFAGVAVVDADGLSDPVTSTSGADAADVMLDTTGCSNELVDCTVTASVTANPGGGFMVPGGENFLVYAAFGGIAIADLNTAGVVEVDGLNTMNVNPGQDFTLVPLMSTVPEPGTALLLGMGLLGLACRQRRA